MVPVASLLFLVAAFSSFFSLHYGVVMNKEMMRNVLQTAVEELGHALPGSEIIIQFQTDQNHNKAAH